MRDEINYLRKNQVFRIYLLYSKQNSLVHEGSYSTQIHVMVEFLEKLLAKTLLVFLENSDKKKIEHIIHETNMPYQVKE